uniref:Uncharacterized protein n=1 Tax=Anguilla anguilla TaxID=7936 RepID=A0A0E9TTA1_ANGAN
MDTVHKTGKSS